MYHDTYESMSMHALFIEVIIQFRVSFAASFVCWYCLKHTNMKSKAYIQHILY